MVVKSHVLTIMTDPAAHMPVVILKEFSGERTVALPVEISEANSIALRTMGTISDKANSVDLAQSILVKMGGSVDKVVIQNGESNGLTAVLSISVVGGRPYTVEARPGDAISLALRNNAPILIDETVFEKLEHGKVLSETEKLRINISRINTLDFGRYYFK